MPSTFTTMLGLEKQGNGENNNDWGNRTNVNLDRLDGGIGSFFVAEQTILSPQNTVVLALPAKWQSFRLAYRDVNPSVPSALAIRYSTDGGLNYLAGTEYSVQISTETGATIAASGSDGRDKIVCSPITAAGGLFGTVDIFSVSTKYTNSYCQGALSTGGMFITRTGAMVLTAQTATHIALFWTGAVFQSGYFLLTGR